MHWPKSSKPLHTAHLCNTDKCIHNFGQFRENMQTPHRNITDITGDNTFFFIELCYNLFYFDKSLSRNEKINTEQAYVTGRLYFYINKIDTETEKKKICINSLLHARLDAIFPYREKKDK